MSSFWQGKAQVFVTNQIQSSLVPVSPLAGNGITGVPDNVQTTIVTFTAPNNFLLGNIVTSGTTYAKYQLYLNLVLIDTRRGGPERTMIFTFPSPLQMNTGDILDVKVTHYDTAQTADFESTIYGGLPN